MQDTSNVLWLVYRQVVSWLVSFWQQQLVPGSQQLAVQGRYLQLFPQVHRVHIGVLDGRTPWNGSF